MRRYPESLSLQQCFLALSLGLFLGWYVPAQAWPSGSSGGGQAASANYDESKAGTLTLPNPLVFNDGRPVRSADEWRNRRRAEILQLLETNVFGRSPAPPKHVRFNVFDLDRGALAGKATRKQVTIYFPTPNGEAREDLLIYVPAGAPKPVPVILTMNFDGNQSVIDDPGVRTSSIWIGMLSTVRQPPEHLRGGDQQFEVEKVLTRGYAFATVCYHDIEPDFNKEYNLGGIRRQFFRTGQTKSTLDDWGAIGAWAYGMSRAMDYFETDNDLDAHRVAVMGHSRLGKTALWAGAQDTRFAMVLSSCSGRGGASPWRRNYGETLQSMSRACPFWFCPNLFKYLNNVEKLPVDSDDLIALIAPRPVYITSAQDDRWADPRGMFMASVAASPVYDLLNARGLGTDHMPPLNQPIMHGIAFHIRDGVHAVTAFDWDQFLAFADMHLRPR